MTDQMGSELLARQMVNEGVEDLFYIMGGPIIEAAGYCAEHGIRTIDCRHEQGAAMAAHGYARVKRVPGVCMAASGPATTNLLTGVANAYLDCVPMVALGGAAMAAAEEGGGGMHAGQIIAIAIGIAGALLLVGLSAGYILPKPPKF